MYATAPPPACKVEVSLYRQSPSIHCIIRCHNASTCFTFIPFHKAVSLITVDISFILLNQYCVLGNACCFKMPTKILFYYFSYTLGGKKTHLHNGGMSMEEMQSGLSQSSNKVGREFPHGLLCSECKPKGEGTEKL